MHSARHADLFDDFLSGTRLPRDDVYVPPHHQPVNPEDEDDVVPDQHAAFGIQRATQRQREPAWRDLGLRALMARGPPAAGAGVGVSGGLARRGPGGAAAGAGAVGGARPAGAGGAQGGWGAWKRSGLPR
jgi:hypothetical protein